MTHLNVDLDAYLAQRRARGFQLKTGEYLLRQFCGFDANRLGSMAVRFTTPVLPGDLLRFEFWGSGPGEVRFRALATNRDNAVVLDRCTAEIR